MRRDKGEHKGSQRPEVVVGRKKQKEVCIYHSECLRYEVTGTNNCHDLFGDPGSHRSSENLSLYILIDVEVILGDE